MIFKNLDSRTEFLAGNSQRIYDGGKVIYGDVAFLI